MNRILSREFALPAILTTIMIGMAYNHGAILVYGVVLFYFLLMIVQKRTKLRINSSTILFHVIIICYFIGLLNQKSLYKANVEDIINIISGVLIHFIVNQLDKESYIKSFNICKILSVWLLTGLGIYSLYKYYLLTKGIYLSDYYFDGIYAFGTSLSSDNNMFSLAMLIGFIFSISLLRIQKTWRMRFLLTITTTVIGLSIGFSGSRRAYIFLLLITVILLLRGFKTLLNKSSVVKGIKFLYFVGLISSILFAVIYSSGYKIDFKKIIEDPQINTTIERFSTIGSSNAAESFLPRMDRWEYAAELIQAYRWEQLILGGGFDYLNLYPERFPSHVREDYPHNPIISAFLYSGLFGSMFLIVIIIMTFYLLFKYRNSLGNEMLLIYIATFTYIFVSGNSIFSYKIYLFLYVILISSSSIFAKRDQFSVNYPKVELRNDLLNV